jgi:lipopolysaccharide transport protein LptA
MSPWQRRLRLFVGLFGIAFAIVVFFAIRPKQPNAGQAPVERVDPRAVVESAGGQVLEWGGTRQDFRIEYGQLLSYADGSTRFAGGVKTVVDSRAGHAFVVTAREAESAPQQTHIVFKGDVHLETDDGITVTADEATYSQAEEIVRTPGPVRFSKGRLSGTSVGASYDQIRDVLWLLDQAVIEFSPEENGGAGTSIRAGAAGMARGDGYVRFERGVRITRDGGEMEADQATAYLSADEQDVEMMELRGNSRVAGAGGDRAALESMSARNMNLRYAPGGALQNATLAGESVVRIADGAGSGGRRIAAEWIEIQMADGGEPVTGISAGEDVHLELPGERDTPARTITAESMAATGNESAGLTEAVFTGNVVFQEMAPPVSRPSSAGSTARVARAPRLELAVTGGMASIEDAAFSGGVSFDDGARNITAGEARYRVTQQLLLLRGVDPRTGQNPRVVDESATITAEEMEIALGGRALEARGGVTSALKATGFEATARATTGGGARRPGMLSQDQPVDALADKLVYDGAERRAVYTGNARLFQGETAIQGDEIVLDDSKGDLVAAGSVRARLMLDQAGQDGESRKVPTTAAAEKLHYEEAHRRATFATRAHVVGAEGDLTADTIELYLEKEGSALERAEARGEVTLRLDGRSAYGDTLLYFALDERYEVIGSPVRIEEELRVTTGKTLTFFKSTDRIVVDGNERRTETKKKGPGHDFD